MLGLARKMQTEPFKIIRHGPDRSAGQLTLTG